MISVREATLADIQHLIDFQLKMAWETESLKLDEKVLAEGLRQLLEDPTKGKYYIAEIDNQVVGCLMTTYEWSDWRCGNVLWIQSVYIAAQHRGKGVYKGLYEYMKALVAKPGSGYRGIRLYVDKTNKDAQQVYEKLGMNGEHYQVYEWMNPNN